MSAFMDTGRILVDVGQQYDAELMGYMDSGVFVSVGIATTIRNIVHPTL